MDTGGFLQGGGLMHDRIALGILVFVGILEAANVIIAMSTGRPTIPAVDLLFTTVGGAILTDSLTRRHRGGKTGPGGGGPP